MAGFKAISRNFVGGVEKNYKKTSGYLVFGLEFNSEVPEYGKVATLNSNFW
jgi:hypothetical protein